VQADESPLAKHSAQSGQEGAQLQGVSRCSATYLAQPGLGSFEFKEPKKKSESMSSALQGGPMDSFLKTIFYCVMFISKRNSAQTKRNLVVYGPCFQRHNELPMTSYLCVWPIKLDVMAGCRWQIELSFKCMQKIMGLGHPPIEIRKVAAPGCTGNSSLAIWSCCANLRCHPSSSGQAKSIARRDDVSGNRSTSVVRSASQSRSRPG
jgi:hypothetical protein